MRCRVPFAIFLIASLSIGLPPRFSVAQEKAMPKIRTVALVGDPAPGLNGVTFSVPSRGGKAFNEVHVNSAGRVCFDAGLAGDGIPTKYSRDKFYNAAGAWAEQSGGLTMVARRGDQSPGDASMKITDFEFRWAGEDQVAVVADGREQPQKGAFNSTIYFVDASGEFKPVAVTGDAIITAAGKITKLDDFDDTDYTPAGKVTFFDSSSSKKGIWSCDINEAKLVAHKMQQCPGLEDGMLFRALGDSVANRHGSVLFEATCAKKTTRFSSLWLADPFSPDPPKMIIESKKPAPEIDGATLKKFSFLAINSNNQILAYASLDGDGLDKDRIRYNAEALYMYDGGHWKKILRRGDPAPGASTPNTIATGIRNQILNEDGHVAIIGSGEREGERGGEQYLWSNASGEFKVIAETKTPAPGQGEGVTFSSLSDQAFGASNQLIFTALQSDRTRGIWVSRDAGEPQLLIKIGDSIEVRPGDQRNLKRIDSRWSVGPSADGNSSYIAFIAYFEDESQGVLVATVD